MEKKQEGKKEIKVEQEVQLMKKNKFLRRLGCLMSSVTIFIT